MLLYHSTIPEAAVAILRGGFRDSTGYYLTSQLWTGVWLSDKPLDPNEGAKGDTLIVVEMPESEVLPYEWVQEPFEDWQGKLFTPPYREFLIPAELVNRYRPFAPIGGVGVSGQCPVGIVEKAHKLAHRLEAKGPLPDDYKPEELYNVILADIRHEYTNYEDLLNELPLCESTEPDWHGCDLACPFRIQGDGGDSECECPYSEQAHDELKWAAKGLAERLYGEWISKQGERGGG